MRGSRVTSLTHSALNKPHSTAAEFNSCPAFALSYKSNLYIARARSHRDVNLRHGTVISADILSKLFHCRMLDDIGFQSVVLSWKRDACHNMVDRETESAPWKSSSIEKLLTYSLAFAGKSSSFYMSSLLSWHSFGFSGPSIWNPLPHVHNQGLTGHLGNACGRVGGSEKQKTLNFVKIWGNY